MKKTMLAVNIVAVALYFLLIVLAIAISVLALMPRVWWAGALANWYEAATGNQIAAAPTPFTDTAGLTTRQRDAIGWMYSQHITAGTGPDTFSPYARPRFPDLLVLVGRTWQTILKDGG